ncbi:hypothetical protein ACFL2Z_00025 [Candidatus Eisenbacteria bacterium]|uniref:Uncharacterized protein n=1 Tax=Eiseniibacteriota bacterium TaxID=2212470 RepID=A0ABV6YMK7_UNCEI
MREILSSLKRSINHMQVLDRVFSKSAYPEREIYLQNAKRISDLSKSCDQWFTDELYFGDDGRQMILNDILEYVFTGRGYYYMAGPQDIEKKEVFVKIVLHFVNQLMLLESISVNSKLRKEVMDRLRKTIGDNHFFEYEESEQAFKALRKFKGDVHFDTAATNRVPPSIVREMDTESGEKVLKRFDGYCDSLLPKLPHGLWRELIVYIQLLRINAGYILPLLLSQRILSKRDVLKPPDFLVIKENGELVGVEVGAGKEGQSSDFSTALKCQMVTAENTNIPPRCPICGKWILFCDKVIKEFADLDNPLYNIRKDIRCAHDCEFYTYTDVLSGKCPYVKYRGRISKTAKPRQITKYDSAFHYHYSCMLDANDSVARSTIKKQRIRWERHLARRGSVTDTTRSMTINCLKTNYPYFAGLDGLENYSRETLDCYSKYRGSDNCSECRYQKECERLSKIIPLIDSCELSKNRSQIICELGKLLDGAD